jgi:hypothetical protein
MAFNTTEIHRIVDAGAVIVYGTYENTEGDAGGVITVRDMHYILNVTLQPCGDAVKTSQSVVNESMTGSQPRIDKNSATIVTTENEAGLWMITGI